MAEIIWNEIGLHELFHGSEGPVARDLGRRAIRVEAQAKLNASHPAPSVRGSGPAVQSGRLRSSITWEIGRDEIGLFARVGSNVVYAYAVEVTYDRPYLRPALSAASF